MERRGRARRTRRAKGDSGKVGGPGKGPDNRGNRQQPKAGACVDLARAAAEGDAAVKLPRGGVALDSWANVWLKHQRNQPPSYYQGTLHLAYGECFCHKESLQEGVPIVQVPWTASGENINLFPEGLWWERGCAIIRGDTLTARSPKGHEITVRTWGNMHYTPTMNLISSSPTSRTTTRRVAPGGQLRLRRRRGSLAPSNTWTKYRNMPDLYWQDDVDAIVTPEVFDRMGRTVVQKSRKVTYCKVVGALLRVGRSLGTGQRTARGPPPSGGPEVWVVHGAAS